MDELLEYALHNRQLQAWLYLAANFGGTALLGWALGRSCTQCFLEAAGRHCTAISA